MYKRMTLKTEPMDMEADGDMFRMKSFTRSIIPKSFDLTDDQKAMRLPSPDEPFITGIFHRGNDANQSYNMVPSDVSAMQQAHYFSGRNVKSEAKEEDGKDEEYPMYTIARSEMELNSRLLPKKYKCKFCVYKTSYKSDLNRHLRRHAKKDNIYNCDICNLPFRSISKVYSHRQQCHADGNSSGSKEDLSLACTMCTFRCAEKDIALFQLHVQKHIEDNTCGICNKSFNNPTAVEKHKKIYHQVTNEVVFPPQALRSVDMQYIPEASRNATVNSSVLDIDSDHSPAGGSSASSSHDGSTNSTPVPFTSQQVKGGIRTLFERRDKHNGNEWRIKDYNRSPSKAGNDFSDKSAQQSKNLSDITHHVGNAQKTKSNIPADVSMENGNGLKSYKCEKCDSIFLDMRDLFIHMSVCLQQHMSVNTTNFNCPICFFTSEELELFTSHMIRHTIDKFSCDLCNKPFSRYRNVLSHKRKVHKIDFRCKRSAAKMKFIGHSKSTQKSLSAKPTNSSPYSKETIGNISKMVQEDKRQEKGEEEGTCISRNMTTSTATVETQTTDEKQLTLSGTKNEVKQSLMSGRYAKLISDFDDFSLKPFACALCFHRTDDLNDLKSHVQNHVLGSRGEDPNYIKLNFECLSDSKSKVQQKDTIYNIAVTDDSVGNQNSVCINLADNAIETSIISSKESQNYAKQIKYLENLLKKTRNSNSIYLSRTLKRKTLPNTKSHPCKICKKEFSMHILAKRHMDKIHNLGK